MSKDDINNLIKKYELEQIFKNIPNGFDTNVGVNGDSLSGGQKQLIQLLRCYNKNNKIIILDEPTSALDSATKKAVINIINDISKDSTLIIITHDDTNLELTNESIKIVNGKITKITLNADITVGTTYKLWSSATARITTSGYTTTQIVPIIAPIGGYESKLETTLPSWYIGVGADTVNSQFVPSGTSYRQISIIKNPKRNNNDNLDDATVDRVHKSFSTSENERLVLSGNNVDTGWKIKQGNYLVATISAVELKDNVWSYYYYNSIQAGVFNIDDTQTSEVLYRFIVDELFQLEIDDIKTKGSRYFFDYEDFHPNVPKLLQRFLIKQKNQLF
jgi:energy-coupling factor transporter ATP-binding protein EcfA2